MKTTRSSLYLLKNTSGFKINWRKKMDFSEAIVKAKHAIKEAEMAERNKKKKDALDALLMASDLLIIAKHYLEAK